MAIFSLKKILLFTICMADGGDCMKLKKTLITLFVFCMIIFSVIAAFPMVVTVGFWAWFLGGIGYLIPFFIWLVLAFGLFVGFYIVLNKITKNHRKNYRGDEVNNFIFTIFATSFIAGLIGTALFGGVVLVNVIAGKQLGAELLLRSLFFPLTSGIIAGYLGLFERRKWE